MAGPSDRQRAKPPASKPAPPPPAGIGVPEPPTWWRTLRADPSLHIRVAIGGGLIGVVLVIWWLLTRGDATTAI
ncbi:MAG TPA: hypothetical protein VFK02_22120, partial [Kofleriaceae bacterium]|nr:hypothetical protein [Kofleriaceae bacterium]